MSAGALLVAIVGAESTGKTTLAAALAAALAERGWRSAWVPETLREWCTATGRTPLVHEQASILRRQHERIAEAAQAHELVICDTTALMTAVYSRQIFGDESLQQRAVALQRQMALTLLTALDLPWVADPLRDGPQVREPVDTMLRELLLRHRLPWALVCGSGPARLEAALAALAPLLQTRSAPSGSPGGRSRRGLFTGLGQGGGDSRRWDCDCCPPPAG